MLFSRPGIQCSSFIISVSSQIPDSRKRPSPTSEAQMPNAPSSKEFDPLSKKSHQDPSKVMSSFGLSNDTGTKAKKINCVVQVTRPTLKFYPLLSQFRHTSFLYNCLYIRFSYESYIILICKPKYMIFVCAVSYEFYVIRFI